MNYEITDKLDVNFALVPHVEASALAVMTDESDKFNEPLVALLSSGSGVPDSGSLASLDQPGVRLSAFVKNPDGSLTMRLHNVYATPASNLDLKLKHKNIVESDLSGQPLTKVKRKRGRYPVAMSKNGLKTFIIK